VKRREEKEAREKKVDSSSAYVGFLRETKSRRFTLHFLFFFGIFFRLLGK
jgi:hypothetical protein